MTTHPQLARAYWPDHAVHVEHTPAPHLQRSIRHRSVTFTLSAHADPDRPYRPGDADSVSAPASLVIQATDATGARQRLEVPIDPAAPLRLPLPVPDAGNHFVVAGIDYAVTPMLLPSQGAYVDSYLDAAGPARELSILPARSLLGMSAVFTLPAPPHDEPPTLQAWLRNRRNQRWTRTDLALVARPDGRLGFTPDTRRQLGRALRRTTTVLPEPVQHRLRALTGHAVGDLGPAYIEERILARLADPEPPAPEHSIHHLAHQYLLRPRTACERHLQSVLGAIADAALEAHAAFPDPDQSLPAIAAELAAPHNVTALRDAAYDWLLTAHAVNTAAGAGTRDPATARFHNSAALDRPLSTVHLNIRRPSEAARNHAASGHRALRELPSCSIPPGSSVFLSPGSPVRNTGRGVTCMLGGSATFTDDGRPALLLRDAPDAAPAPVPLAALHGRTVAVAASDPDQSFALRDDAIQPPAAAGPDPDFHIDLAELQHPLTHLTTFPANGDLKRHGSAIQHARSALPVTGSPAPLATDRNWRTGLLRDPATPPALANPDVPRFGLRVLYGIGDHHTLEDSCALTTQAADRIRIIETTPPHLSTAGDPAERIYCGPDSIEWLSAPSVPEDLTARMLDNIGPDGLVRDGARLEPGDPIRISCTLPAAADGELAWHVDRFEPRPGTAPGAAHVQTRPDARGATLTTVTVTSPRPIRIGDKLISAAGSKYTVSAILDPVDQDLPCGPDDVPPDIYLSATSPTRRENLSDLYALRLGNFRDRLLDQLARDLADVAPGDPLPAPARHRAELLTAPDDPAATLALQLAANPGDRPDRGQLEAAQLLLPPNPSERHFAAIAAHAGIPLDPPGHDRGHLTGTVTFSAVYQHIGYQHSVEPLDTVRHAVTGAPAHGSKIGLYDIDHLADAPAALDELRIRGDAARTATLAQTLREHGRLPDPLRPPADVSAPDRYLQQLFFAARLDYDPLTRSFRRLDDDAILRLPGIALLETVADLDRLDGSDEPHRPVAIRLPFPTVDPAAFENEHRGDSAVADLLDPLLAESGTTLSHYALTPGAPATLKARLQALRAQALQDPDSLRAAARAHHAKVSAAHPDADPGTLPASHPLARATRHADAIDTLVGDPDWNPADAVIRFLPVPSAHARRAYHDLPRKTLHDADITRHYRALLAFGERYRTDPNQIIAAHRDLQRLLWRAAYGSNVRSTHGYASLLGGSKGICSHLYYGTPTTGYLRSGIQPAGPEQAPDTLRIPARAALDLLEPQVFHTLAHTLGRGAAAARASINAVDRDARAVCRTLALTTTWLANRSPSIHAAAWLAVRVDLHPDDHPFGIRIPGQLLDGLGGDFDGDTIRILPLLSRAAQLQALDSHHPSRFLLRPHDGQPMQAVSQDARLGLIEGLDTAAQPLAWLAEDLPTAVARQLRDDPAVRAAAEALAKAPQPRTLAPAAALLDAAQQAIGRHPGNRLDAFHAMHTLWHRGFASARNLALAGHTRFSLAQLQQLAGNLPPAAAPAPGQPPRHPDDAWRTAFTRADDDHAARVTAALAADPGNPTARHAATGLLKASSLQGALTGPGLGCHPDGQPASYSATGYVNSDADAARRTAGDRLAMASAAHAEQVLDRHEMGSFGYATKLLSHLAATVTVTTPDCGSRGQRRPAGPHLEGAWDVEADRPLDANRLRSLGAGDIQVRTPADCKADGLCQRCAGAPRALAGALLPLHGNLVPSVWALTETPTQSSIGNKRRVKTSAAPPDTFVAALREYAGDPDHPPANADATAAAWTAFLERYNGNPDPTLVRHLAHLLPLHEPSYSFDAALRRANQADFRPFVHTSRPKSLLAVTLNPRLQLRRPEDTPAPQVVSLLPDLHRAAALDSPADIERLLADDPASAARNRDTWGRNALFYASSAIVAQRLLDTGLDPNAPDNDGVTAADAIAVSPHVPAGERARILTAMALASIRNIDIRQAPPGLGPGTAAMRHAQAHDPAPAPAAELRRSALTG